MDELLRQFLENSNGVWAYSCVFTVLLACGLGVPLPEDISLILGGLLVHQGSASSLVLMMVVGFFGILGGDSLIYLAGRRFGSRVGRRPGGFLARIITPSKRAKVEGLFASQGQKIVMIARFLPGVRAVTYFTAGSAGMTYSKFILFDGLAALASAPVLVYLGFRFGGELEQLIDGVRRGQVSVIATLMLVLAGYVGVQWLRRRRQQAQAAAAAALASQNSGAPSPAPERDAAPSRLSQGDRTARMSAFE